MADPIAGQTAICGLGVTEMGKIYGHDSYWFASEAIKLAVEDAGIDKKDIDGLLINPGITSFLGGGISIPLQNHLGLRNLRLLNHMNSFGATASWMVHYAAMAVNHGMANYVVCVFADAPLQKGGSAGATYGGGRNRGNVLPRRGDQALRQLHCHLGRHAGVNGDVTGILETKGGAEGSR